MHKDLEKVDQTWDTELEKTAAMNENMGNIEYDLDELRASVPVTMACYVCHFRKNNSHEHGMPNCEEKSFDNANVPVVECEGLCGVTIITDKDLYMIIRSCLPNCRNMYDGVTSVNCCYGDRCNSVTNNGSIRQKTLVAHFITLVYCIQRS